MRKFLLLFLIVAAACSGAKDSVESTVTEEERWAQYAENTTIIRDEFGVPHIYGKTDADAVFGVIYAQCEDDFNRVEMNYINAMGRLAEAEGQGEVMRDLRMKLFIDPEETKTLYEDSPEWLKKLMNAFADAANYYLHTHPEVQPKVIKRFEPWMALTFTEGSIGGDIERGISLRRLASFYDEEELAMAMPAPVPTWLQEPTGSNGFAIAPGLTKNGKALFAINPHTSFFFRSEVHMVSEEGLNAYGAVTWGQFFIYQGFNEHCGWMHTSTYADVLDEFAETINRKADGTYTYTFGNEERPVRTKQITVPYAQDGRTQQRTFTAYYTHHGPIVRKADGKWISMALMQRPIDALTQSYRRTKAQGWESFRQVMQLRTNSSNNTVYADADGTIGYYHGNYLPKRNDSLDWSQPVDGSQPANDHQGLHTLDEMIVVKNPLSGWIQNCNSTPFTLAGPGYSPKPQDYPRYMAPDRENYRGLHAASLLNTGIDNFTLEDLITLAYDPYLNGFDYLFPPLFANYDSAAATTKETLAEPIALLQAWDKNCSANSTETTLAVFWGMNLMKKAVQAEDRNGRSVYEYMEKHASAQMRLEALQEAVATLSEGFGSWQVPFGEVNRYQRVNGEIKQPFSDSEPSLPVTFASARWGSLAAFGARLYPGTKRMYGTRGNSFVAFVEFGDKVVAKSITAGGLSADPASPHFSDQAEMYANAEFKDVRFYREDVEANATKTYHPGE